MPADLALLRLMQLVSPSLPVGGYSYSQGLEYAVDAGWVGHEGDFVHWQRQIIDDQLTRLDWPVLLRLYCACGDDNDAAFRRWSDFLLANRETRESRLEEKQRGQALLRLMAPWPDVAPPPDWQPSLARCQLASMAWLGYRWGIPAQSLALGYGYSWLESSVMAGLKLVPFGQQRAQDILRELAALLPSAFDVAARLGDDELGGGFPLQSIASSLHEHQYSRLFRS
ncbi:urease accessory protein UreF [Martelella alba]|uniref:Urease accessory protein UreF n=1 Tax=Martelella alba TaxID=2590451 RepID=A0ABY2SLR6_9HYPH|nr:urease accessory protein UreF [Martelella alba]TKI06685.1 urease accessory protein UreF [Martelella alba]